MTTQAQIRYRARLAERRMLIDELRKRARQMSELVSEFSGANSEAPAAYWRLRHFQTETERCVGLLERLPEPKKPAKRHRKAKVLRLVKGATS